MADLVILAGAEKDILETYVRYELTEDALGERFSKMLDRSLDQLIRFPESGPVFRREIRRLLVAAFPLGIFYSIESERIIVQAVLDLRQSPEQILRRLEINK